MAGSSVASTSRNNKGNDMNNVRGQTIVVDCGYGKTSCGYCRSPGKTSFAHGLWAHSLTVDDYQDLIDRGWRRSGCFLYKTEMEKTCCPPYTIRLKASEFTPSKDQSRTLKRIQRFLDGSLDITKSIEAIDAEVSSNQCDCTCHQVRNSAGNDSMYRKNEVQEKEEKFMKYLSEQVDNAILRSIEIGKLPANIQFPKALVKMVTGSKRKIRVQDAEDLLYSSNIAFQIVARLKAVQSDKNEKVISEQLGPQRIAEELAESLKSVCEVNGLVPRACNGYLNFHSPFNQNFHGKNAVEQACQKESKRCKRKECCLNKTSENFKGMKRKMEIMLKQSSFDPKEYALYKKYQIKVHNDTADQVSENSYKRFLVDSPLIYVPSSGDGSAPSCGFGSFHQQYILDGHLVAVGVIDVLPKCLSSKYLFWDPDYSFISLGKYSSLQEIDWVKKNQATCQSLEYYYLGLYIHSCSKMRYKAAFRPSELLCPLRYQWINFDIARPFLDKKPCVVLSDIVLSKPEGTSLEAADVNPQQLCKTEGDQSETLVEHSDFTVDPDLESSDDESSSENSGSETDSENPALDEILLELMGSRFRYKLLRQHFPLSGRRRIESKLRKYKRVVGDELSQRMVYSLDFRNSSDS